MKAGSRVAMRVYEFSKQSGIPTRELLEILREKGFVVPSHMSVLGDEELNFLKKRLTPEVPAQPKEIKESQQNQSKEKPINVPQQPQPIKKNNFSPDSEQKKSAPSSPVSEVRTTPKKVILVQPMQVADAAQQLGQPVTAVILTLLKWGIIASKNQLLSEDVVIRLAHHYEAEIIKPEKVETEKNKGTIAVESGEFKERLPVVVVMGHVDHGKTSLLDFIRKTRVASREKGGITQHLGAYEANTPQGNIVFIDTPGHEAFSKMRMRGVKVADIAILVVAADDGVMPQTVEAMKHAKAMNVPIVVAINKIDKVEPARIEQVKQELSRHDLLPEEWGGTTIVVPISAKTGQGIDQLLEMIILQSQLMELKADVSGSAKGYVLEAKLEKGRGPVATVLAQHGHITVGDYFLCGSTHGRINSLVDSHGMRLMSVGPSVPVQVAGFSSLPEAGDYFEVVTREEYQRSKVRVPEIKNVPNVRSFGKENALNLVVKTDTNSSKEALLGSIAKISKGFEKQFNIIHATIGDINESDVALAATTNALIVGLHIKIGQNAHLLAQKSGVTIELFDIIYKLLERLEEVAEGAKEIKMVRQKIGEAVVRKVFDIKGLGVIAGCYVKDGRFTRDGLVTIWRGNQKIGEGAIKSLQRDKKMVKEVHAGYECAFLVENFSNWEPDDRVDCFTMVPETEK